ncbi:MAG: chemotaxis protein CheX [Desulfobulbus sp.]|uniref:chemotaxis protein CheX n=1 Tax=Desulfobulbus sp. TaxID=895 RepID=UPI002841F4A9|nr:chemotaxis protein CheX [Desulfobulbus sp.]MDR2550779.1 chemotaxis protein CheX [Desulfobulbus sp.]
MNSFTELSDKLIESTIEIFTGMVMMDISSAGEPVEKTGTFKKSITGMVGLAGTHKGILAVHLPNEVALAVTSNFLGVDVGEINEDVQDAIGEIANMLGGNLKTILSDRGRDIQLSLPSTIFGDEYAFSSQAESDQIILPFQSPNGMFYVEVELER